MAISLGRLEYSPSTLEVLLNVGADPLYEDRERMVTSYEHHVSMLYGPWIPADERKELEDTLNDKLQKWISYRSDPFFRIKELLCTPTHAYIKRLPSSVHEYWDKGRLLHWTGPQLHEAVEKGIISPIEPVRSDSDPDDADRECAPGEGKSWIDRFSKLERDQDGCPKSVVEVKFFFSFRV